MRLKASLASMVRMQRSGDPLIASTWSTVGLDRALWKTSNESWPRLTSDTSMLTPSRRVMQFSMSWAMDSCMRWSERIWSGLSLSGRAKS